MTPGDSTPESWKLHVDGSSNITSGGAGVILESRNGVVIEQSVRYEFPVSNNQAEYEALLAGLALAREVGAKIIEEVVKSPSVSTTTNAHLTFSNQGSWTYPILQYLLDGTLPPDPKEGKRITREAANYTIIAGQLYKRGFPQPLLKCVEPRDTEYILREIHEGCCGHHVEGKTHANIHQAAPHQLSTISAERPFGTWGIDLVGPFPTAPGQLRYLIVAIDYYTKWIEAEPLSSITATQCRKFLWRQIITRFGIPEIVISDNETQFADKKFREFLEGLRVSHRFSSTTTGETPFRLTYDVEAVIPVEIGDPSPRKIVGGNDEEAERDLIDETRSIAHLRELALKQRISLRYNHGVIRREFATDDLVLRRNDIGPPTRGEGKLTPNWEGPYRIKAVIGKGAYKLERLNGVEVLRTWNAANLR
ncbi:uncharacterized protein [Arachis hypogaea]|uniref:uncharacterized protein n=1 Tax=Arachis hypogaea TaxID=3818 RepID=UPI000DECB90B|nr:uncharacterized protein LOC112756544 [Arachis hypogaea]